MYYSLLRSILQPPIYVSRNTVYTYMYVYFVGIVDVEVIEIFQIYENSTIMFISVPDRQLCVHFHVQQKSNFFIWV